MAITKHRSLQTFGRMKKAFMFVLALTLVFTGLAACTPTTTDEELIEERIEAFLTAYNSGDMEATLECLDAKSRNSFQALLNLLGGLAGSLTGFNIDLSDLFSLGINTASGDFMGLEITDIHIQDSKNATVTTTMTLTGAGIHTIYFIMVYENDGWYIHDMTDKKPTNLIIDSTQTDANTVIPTQRESFVDGVANIYYSIDNVNHYGIINTIGEIIYTTNKRVSLINIGGGSTIVEEYDSSKQKYSPAYMVNSAGIPTATFEENTQLIAYGDGLALMYQRKDSITSIQHLYGIVDSSGTWIQPMIDLGISNSDKHYYAGDGIFALAYWTGYYHSDYLFWNSQKGNMFYVSGLKVPPKFKDGVAFVHNTNGSKITTASNVADPSKWVETPYYFLLYKDGTFKAYDMNGKKFNGCSNGFIYYSVDEKTMYIVDITSPTFNIFTYNQYPPAQIESIDFVGDYGLVTIRGVNGHIYFTLIDKQGHQRFEPIEAISYESMLGKHSPVYSDETIIFENPDKKYCIADQNGQIIATEYGYIGAFSNDVAIACIGNSQYDSDALWIFINKSNEQVMQAVKQPSHK